MLKVYHHRGYEFVKTTICSGFDGKKQKLYMIRFKTDTEKELCAAKFGGSYLNTIKDAKEAIDYLVIYKMKDSCKLYENPDCTICGFREGFKCDFAWQ